MANKIRKKPVSRAKRFDVIIIGAGAAGFSAAEVAASEGAKVCLIEKGRLGGECPNWACIPTKAILKSAKVYYDAKHRLHEYGVHATNVSFSYTRMMERKDSIVGAVTGKGKKLGDMLEKSGVEVVRGSAEFVDAHTVEVTDKKYRADSIIIATGTRQFVPPIVGLKDIDYMDFKDAVSLKKQPGSVAIIGGGPVACEFATFFSFLGTTVNMLEISPRLLGREDVEISEIVERALVRRKVKVHTKTKTLSVKKEGRKFRVVYQEGDGERKSILCDKVLVAAGKRANIESLNLKKAKVAVDDKGRLKMKVTLQTSVPHIFAAGDVSGGMQFTHTAHAEGYVAAANAVKKVKRGLLKRDERVVPRVTFTDPEVASVGMTPEDAKRRKKSFHVTSFPVGALGRSVTEGDRVGLVKLVIEKRTRKILGGHMAGPHAGEVIHEVALAMHANLKVNDLAEMIHAFPTFSEAVVAAAAQI